MSSVRLDVRTSSLEATMKIDASPVNFVSLPRTHNTHGGRPGQVSLGRRRHGAEPRGLGVVWCSEDVRMG